MIFKIVLDFVKIYVHLLDKNNFLIISLYEEQNIKKYYYIIEFSPIFSCNQLDKIVLIMKAVRRFLYIKIMPWYSLLRVVCPVWLSLYQKM